MIATQSQTVEDIEIINEYVPIDPLHGRWGANIHPHE